MEVLKISLPPFFRMSKKYYVFFMVFSQKLKGASVEELYPKF